MALWQCPVCKLGPIAVDVFPVFHVCITGDVRPGNDEDLACPHRGEAIGEHICEQCGLRGQIAPVYQCTLHHGPCVKRAWTLRQSKIEAAGERVCFQCPDRPGAIYDADGRLRS